LKDYKTPDTIKNSQMAVNKALYKHKNKPNIQAKLMYSSSPTKSQHYAPHSFKFIQLTFPGSHRSSDTMTNVLCGASR